VALLVEAAADEGEAVPVELVLLPPLAPAAGTGPAAAAVGGVSGRGCCALWFTPVLVRSGVEVVLLTHIKPDRSANSPWRPQFSSHMFPADIHENNSFPCTPAKTVEHELSHIQHIEGSHNCADQVDIQTWCNK
jgi:hypothetical protein